MAPLKYQNPNDANVAATLDSHVAYPGVDTSVAAGAVEVRREIVTPGDSSGTNAAATTVDLLERILAELVEIRYAMGKLTGELLQPGAHANNSPNETGTIV